MISPDDMMTYGTEGAVDPVMASAVPEMGLLMLPSSGVTEMLGYAPDPFGEGYLPSTAELVRQGDIAGLGYQGLGLLGDVMYAASPFMPFLAPMATGVKGVRAANIAESAAKITDDEIIKMAEESSNSPFFRDATATNLKPKEQKLLERDPYKFSNALSVDPVSNIQPVVDMSQNPLLGKHIPTSIEDLQGEAIVYAQGDITRGGGLLTGVNNTVFEEPVKLQGGKNFGLLVPDDDFGWASGKGITTDYANSMKAAQKELGEDIPVNLMYATMGSEGGDFALHTGETFAELVKGAKISKADQAKINEHVRNNVDPDFVGIKSKKLRSYLQGLGGGKRAALLKSLDLQGFYNAGLPHIGAARYAVAEPEMIGVPSFMSGSSFFRIDPTRSMTYRPDLHSTYDYSVPRIGDMKKLDFNVPSPLLFPDAYSELAKFDKSGKPTGVSMRQYGLDKKKPFQLVDQEVVDNVMRYNELLGR